MNASWTVYLRSIRFAYCWTLLMLFVLLWWLLLLLINKTKNIHSTWKDTVPSVSTGSSQSHPHIYEEMHYQRNSFHRFIRAKTLYACIGSGENRGSKPTNQSAAFSTNQRWAHTHTVGLVRKWLNFFIFWRFYDNSDDHIQRYTHTVGLVRNGLISLFFFCRLCVRW